MNDGGKLLASALAVGAIVAGCDRQDAATSPAGTGSARPPATASPTPTRTYKPGLLTVHDLPDGFEQHALTARNLPSHLTGCPELERLMDGSLGAHREAEFFKQPLGPWIDEAVIVPRHGGAKKVTAQVAKAIDGCSSVTVTEEGHQVTLKLGRAATPAGVTAPGVHAYSATGSLKGIGLRMDIVVAPAGRRVVLLTNAALAADMDEDLTASATTTALGKAALM